jgi:hypothetical protein
MITDNALSILVTGGSTRADFTDNALSILVIKCPAAGIGLQNTSYVINRIGIILAVFEMGINKAITKLTVPAPVFTFHTMQFSIRIISIVLFL